MFVYGYGFGHGILQETSANVLVNLQRKGGWMQRERLEATAEPHHTRVHTSVQDHPWPEKWCVLGLHVPIPHGTISFHSGGQRQDSLGIFPGTEWRGEKGVRMDAGCQKHPARWLLPFVDGYPELTEGHLNTGLPQSKLMLLTVTMYLAVIDFRSLQWVNMPPKMKIWHP